jgi:flagellar export protein FliJ
MAKKFKFRLAQVLQFRNLVRDEKKRILADKNRSLRSAEDRLQELETACMNCQSPEGLQANSTFEIESLFLLRIIDEIEKQKVVIQDLVTEVNLARQDYLEVHKEVEMLEKLKEKQSTEYHDHINHEEAKFLDELAVQRAGKTQG